MRVEVQDADPLIGDEISRVATWGGTSDVELLAGKPVRLRFVMRDADLYSIQFEQAPSTSIGPAGP